MDKIKLKEKLEAMAMRDNAVMRVLKVTDISHVIANTSGGSLVLKLPFKGTGNDYKFVLDAVPYSDKENKELMALFGGVLINSLA